MSLITSLTLIKEKRKLSVYNLDVIAPQTHGLSFFRSLHSLLSSATSLIPRPSHAGSSPLCLNPAPARSFPSPTGPRLAPPHGVWGCPSDPSRCAPALLAISPCSADADSFSIVSCVSLYFSCTCPPGVYRVFFSYFVL